MYDFKLTMPNLYYLWASLPKSEKINLSLKNSANFLHAFSMYVPCLWLVINAATRCSTVLLITWLIGSWTSYVDSHWRNTTETPFGNDLVPHINCIQDKLNNFSHVITIDFQCITFLGNPLLSLATLLLFKELSPCYCLCWLWPRFGLCTARGLGWKLKLRAVHSPNRGLSQQRQ